MFERTLRSERYILAASILEANWTLLDNERAGAAIRDAFEDEVDSLEVSTGFYRIVDFIRTFATEDKPELTSGIENINSFTPEEKVLALLFMAEFVKD